MRTKVIEKELKNFKLKELSKGQTFVFIDCADIYTLPIISNTLNGKLYKNPDKVIIYNITENKLEFASPLSTVELVKLVEPKTLKFEII